MSSSLSASAVPGSKPLAFDDIHAINQGTESLLQDAEKRLLDLASRLGVDVPPQPSDYPEKAEPALGVLGLLRADAVAAQRRVDSINHILFNLSTL